MFASVSQILSNEDDDYDHENVEEGENKIKLNDTKESSFQKDKDGFIIPKPLNRPILHENNEEEKEEEESDFSIDKSENKKRLETPLAAMLPSKYANFDVTELFPEFRHNQVLRFSRLFGPGKSTSLPQIWKNVKNRRKNKQNFENKLRSNKQQKTFHEKEWKFDTCSPESIPSEMIEVDDEIKILHNSFVEKAYNKKVSSENNDDSNVADWRFGPAKTWFDMIKVPENGHNFDYGFKLKNTDEDL